jgi:tetratricopeptide (TPR) repeat protein
LEGGMHDNFSLDAIGIVEGTNKNLLVVDYLRHYAEFFSPYRDEEIVVIEIGVSDGGSLRMWERYFSRATIVGIDVQQRCKQYQGGRIKVEIGSQADREFMKELCTKYTPTIIIDDGSHRADYTMLSFEYLFPKLEPGGCYVIEDLYVHFGPGAPQWRGEAEKTPIEFLQNLTASVLGSIFLPKATRDNTPIVENQVDRLSVVGGAAFIWKRRSESASSEALRRAADVVRRSRHPRSWYFLADYILKNDGSLDEAENAIRKAIELNPKDAIYYQTLAEIFKRKNDVDGAIAVITEGLKVPGIYGVANLEAALARMKNSKHAQLPPAKI